MPDIKHSNHGFGIEFMNYNNFVIILGAGASKGAMLESKETPPLDGEFLFRAKKLVGQNRLQGKAKIAWQNFRRNIEAVGLKPDDIVKWRLEQLSTYLEARIRMRSLQIKAGQPAKYHEALSSLNQLICYVFIKTGGTKPCRLHKKIFEFINPKAVITFNYDLIADQSLMEMNRLSWTNKEYAGSNTIQICSEDKVSNDVSYFALAILSLGLSSLSYCFKPLSYIAAVCMLAMLGILFLSIPLKLNWSSNLYGHLFRRFLVFLIFSIIIYAISYYHVGFVRADGSIPTFKEALYFSATTFITLQYGEYRPLPDSHLLVCIQSIMALTLFVPFFAAYGWLYCQNRLWFKSLEDRSTPENLTIQYDPILGGWRETENERTKAETEERNRSIKAIPCADCGASTLFD